MGLSRSVDRIQISAMILAAAMSLDTFHNPDEIVAALSQYQHRLYRFLVRIVQDPAAAEDLFQQTWMKVIQKSSKYDARSRFDTWLFTVAHNLAIDHLRRKRASSLDEPDESGVSRADRLVASGSDPLERLLEFERGAMLVAAMSELPAIHREVLTLRFEEEMKLEEIAEVTGIPLSTVKSRLHRALEGLRSILESRAVRGRET